MTWKKNPRTATPVRSVTAWDSEVYSSLMWTMCICRGHRIIKSWKWNLSHRVLIRTQSHLCLSYLHWGLFSINRVFGPRSSIFAPVQVKLNCFVWCRQICPFDPYTVGQIQLNWENNKAIKIIIIIIKCQIWSMEVEITIFFWYKSFANLFFFIIHIMPYEAEELALFCFCPFSHLWYNSNYQNTVPVWPLFMSWLWKASW